VGELVWILTSVACSGPTLRDYKSRSIDMPERGGAQSQLFQLNVKLRSEHGNVERGLIFYSFRKKNKALHIIIQNKDSNYSPMHKF